MSLQEIHHGANMLHFSSFLSLQNCSHTTEDIFYLQIYEFSIQ